MLLIASMFIPVLVDRLYQQTPRVQPQKDTYSAPKSEIQEQSPINPSHQLTPVTPSVIPAKDEPKSKQPANGSKDDADGIEYFGILGYRFKITDFALSVFTLLLVIVGSIQLALLRRTVIDTGIAANAATKAAEGAVNVERPYIVISDFELEPISRAAANPDRPIEAYAPVMYFTNHGRTPAFVTRIGYGTAVAENPPPEPTYRFFNLNPDLVIKPIEPLRIRDPSVFKEVTREERQAINEHKKFFWFWVQIQYRDIFNGIGDVGAIARQGRTIYSDRQIRPEPFRIWAGQSDTHTYAYNRYDNGATTRVGKWARSSPICLWHDKFLTGFKSSRG